MLMVLWYQMVSNVIGFIAAEVTIYRYMIVDQSVVILIFILALFTYIWS